MGYQRSFGKRKFSLYGFADLEYNYFWGPYNSGIYPLAYSSYVDLAVPYYSHSYLISGSFFCLSPGIGLRWKLGKHLALSAETTAQFFYAREKRDYYNSSGKSRESIGVNAKPVRFSLGFIF